MAGKEDKCCIEVMGEMTMERSAAFSMLYYPLIGKDATVLYHTLMAIATRSRKIKNHLFICCIDRKKQTCIRTISVVENILQSRRKSICISVVCAKKWK